MEFWTSPLLHHSIVPSLQVQLQSGLLGFDFIQDSGAEGDIGDALAGIIFVEGDLLRFGAAFLVAGENLADFDQLFPADHPPVDRIVNISLLVLNRLLDRDDAMDVAARQSRIIDFTPFCRREPAFHETDIAADDRRYMLAGFEPIAIEDRHAGIGGGQHNIDAAHSLCR